jgi:hypothetical protein
MVQNHPELPRFFNRLENIAWYPYLTTKDVFENQDEMVPELSVHILNNVTDFLNKEQATIRVNQVIMNP